MTSFIYLIWRVPDNWGPSDLNSIARLKISTFWPILKTFTYDLWCGWQGVHLKKNAGYSFMYLFQRPRRDTKNCAYWWRVSIFSQAEKNYRLLLLVHCTLFTQLLFIGGFASFQVLELRPSPANSNSSSSTWWWRQSLGTVPGCGKVSVSVFGP